MPDLAAFLPFLHVCADHCLPWIILEMRLVPKPVLYSWLRICSLLQKVVKVVVNSKGNVQNGGVGRHHSQISFEGRPDCVQRILCLAIIYF